MSTQDDEVENSSAPLIEHLAELRTRLIRSVIAFIIGIVLAFVVAEPILQFLPSGMPQYGILEVCIYE